MKAILALLAALCVVVSAQAWKRLYYSTSELVNRSELIVVGRVKPDSIVLVPHQGGTSWEHHCDLLISEVLKGTNAAPSRTISINYGLEPLVGGFISNQYGVIDLVKVQRGQVYPKDVIEILDRGNSYTTFVPITGDIRTNHIWLLRREKSGVNTGMIGVTDPQDIQPVGMKSES